MLQFLEPYNIYNFYNVNIYFSLKVAEQKESFSDFPVNWASVPSTGFKLIPVPNHVRSKIERDFATTMAGRMSYVVVSVEEVCNKQLYRQYKV